MSTVDSKTNKTLAWTEEQRSVIEADCHSRQLVEAGPGTGKTAVACARVARLAGQGVNPSSILMFSFTRTAVAELRNRIRGFSDNPEIAAVRIATLDSQAWYFRYGTGSDFESLTGCFDSNIASAIKLLDEGNDVLTEYLNSTSHLIIDEAQDLTSLRGRLVAKLIEKVPPACGVTIFADPCQGIYGFTNDFEDGVSENGTFLESFSFEKANFERRSLSVLHRTSEQDVISVFDATRYAVSTQCQWPAKVVETIQEYACKLDGSLDDQLDETCLVLYRRRAQALMDAQHYPYYCRLRMSGLPACIHPWIGAVLSRFNDNVIHLDQFVELWESTVDIDTLLYDSIASHEAWNLLHEHAASRFGGVSLVRLREVLGRSKPHADFLISDYGMWGPTFSTIHGSKGREAENVVLMLPRNDRTLVIPDDQPNAARRNCEESRVYYVGATRAKSTLEYDDAKSLIGATSVNGGRVWHSYNRGRGKPATANVQFGTSGDLDETALVRRDFCESEADAIKNVEALLELHRSFVIGDVPPSIDLYLEPRELEGETEWRYRLQQGDNDDSEQSLGWLNASVGQELFSIANEVGRRVYQTNLRPPTRVSGYSDTSTEQYRPALRMLGLRTVVVPPEKTDDLYEPFRTSGFLLAPILFGFPRIMFPHSRK